MFENSEELSEIARKIVSYIDNTINMTDSQYSFIRDLSTSVESGETLKCFILTLLDLPYIKGTSVAVYLEKDINAADKADEFDWIGFGYFSSWKTECFKLNNITRTQNFIEMYSDHEVHHADGNVVKKMGSSSREIKKDTDNDKKIPVSIWIGGDVTDAEEKEARSTLKEILAKNQFVLEKEDSPKYGSYYQSFKFLYKGRHYLRATLSNIASALKGLSLNTSITGAERLSKMLEKHDNIIIQVDSLIAAKFTKNKKTESLIVIVPDRIKDELTSKPHLLNDPEAVIHLICGRRVVSMHDKKGVVVSMHAKKEGSELPKVKDEGSEGKKEIS